MAEYSNGAKPQRSFYYTHEKVKSKSQRQEVKGSGLKGEELSENLIERFEESERRTETDIKKHKLISKTKEIRKKAMERFGETRKRKGQGESDTGKKLSKSGWFSSRKT